ncbi:MAG: hypothetical protein PUE41_08000 [bacterium]|nr:hypothetical protein [bacterium]
MKKWLAKVMVGRYGVDQLTNAMLVLSMVLLVVALFFGNSIVNTILWTLAVLLLVAGYYRIFSKKTSQRYQENQKYLRLRNRITGRFRSMKERLKQRKTHRFFKCPQCGVTVRVPKGKGKIKITCPKCKTAFVRNT